jgi:hypothetical protein
MTEKYSFPVAIHIEVDQPLTGKEIQAIKNKMIEQLDYAVADLDFISDAVQEVISPKLTRIRVKSADFIQR